MKNLIIGILFIVIGIMLHYNLTYKATPCTHAHIVFTPEVDTNDLNTSDVFRIAGRKDDTLIFTYYY